MGARAGRTRRRWLINAVAALAILALVGAVAIRLAVNPERIAEKIRSQGLPAASRALHRNVTAQQVSVRLFPPRVTLEGVVVEGERGEQPFLSIQRLTLWPDLWRLALSRGRDARLRSVVAERPVVNLVRYRDGSWNLPQPRSDAQTQQPGAGGSGKSMEIAQLEIRDGRVLYADRMERAEVTQLDLGRVGAVLGGIRPGAIASGKLDAAVASKTPNLHVHWGLRGTFDAPEALEGRVRLEHLALESWKRVLPKQVETELTRGDLEVDARLRTEGNQAVVALESRTHVMVRHAPADAHLRATLRAPRDRLRDVEVSMEELTARGPGLDLSAHGQRDVRGLTTVAVTGSVVDLSRLIGPTPEREGQGGDAQGDVANKRAGAPRFAPPLIPTALKALARASNTVGTVALRAVKGRKLEASHLEVHFTLRDGVLSLPHATLRLADGTVALGGSRVDLHRASTRWHIHARVVDMRVDQIERALNHHRRAPIAGAVTGHVEMHGVGNTWPTLRASFRGSGQAHLRDGKLQELRLTKRIRGMKRSVLEAVTNGAINRMAEEGWSGSPIESAQARFAIQNGRIVLLEPAPFQGPEVSGQLGGSVGLDGTLALSGQLRFPPQEVAALTHGRYHSEVETPLSLDGNLRKPHGRVSAGAMAKELLFPHALGRKGPVKR